MKYIPFYQPLDLIINFVRARPEDGSHNIYVGKSSLRLYGAIEGCEAAASPCRSPCAHAPTKRSRSSRKVSPWSSLSASVRCARASTLAWAPRQHSVIYQPACMLAHVGYWLQAEVT